MRNYRFPLLVWGVFAIILGSVLLTGVWIGHISSFASGNSADWTTYLHDVGHSGYNSTETIINSGSASKLKLQWTVNEGSTISTQPVVTNGVIYWGSWDGMEHATKLDGTQAWTTNLGTAPSNCGGALGILSTATVATVTINGTSTLVDFVGSANNKFYALNASTGAIMWQTSLGTPGTQVLWSSPVLYNGSIYIGIASNDCPLVQGQVFQLNDTTGVIQNTFNVVPNGCQGASVWGSVTVDTNNSTLYFATGNPGSCSQAETMADGVVQLNASNLTFKSSWQIPPAQQGNDLDFGSTPTLFTATIGGTVHHLFGVAGKNGIYYAFDEANVSQGPVWSLTIARSGAGPESGDGSVSPSAWDGTNLYVGGGATTISGQSCQGGLRALNPATGAIVWAQCMTDGPVIGAVTLVPGVVAVGEGTAIWLMATSDGHSLFKTWDTSTNSKYYGAPTIANGVVYIGNKNGKFYVYGGLAAPTPTPSPSITPSPTPTTLAQDTFHRTNQTHWGTASDGQVWGRDANTQSSFSINTNMGQVSNGSGQYNALLGPTSTDAEVLFSGSLSSFTKSNLGAVLRWSDSKNWYKVSINGTSLMIQKKVNGTLTLLSKTAFSATAGTSYTLRFRVVGSTLSAKVWQTASTEPANWMITIADSSLLSGRCGIHLQVQSTVTADITSFLAIKP